MERRKEDDGRTSRNLCTATILKEMRTTNMALLISNVAMNISGDLFMSADWGKSWHLGNYFPNAGSYVYETVKAD